MELIARETKFDKVQYLQPDPDQPLPFGVFPSGYRDCLDEAQLERWRVSNWWAPRLTWWGDES